MFRKVMVLLLALMMVVTMGSSALAQGDGKVTIWIGGDGGSVTNWDENIILKTIEEKTGVDVELVFIVDGLNDQLTAAAVSHDMPDIIVSQDQNAKTMLQMWADGGIIAPVTGEVAEAAPNWVKLYETNESLSEIKINGEIYMVPVSWGTGNAPNAGLVHVRADLMKKYGFDAIDTYEQYVAFLRAAVADGHMGITFNGTGSLSQPLNVFLGGMGKPHNGWVKGEDGAYSHWSVQDEVPLAINLLRELIAEGLVDAGVWSCDADTARTHYVSGKAASYIFNGGGHIGRIQNDMTLIDPTFEEMLLPALDFGNGVRGYTQEDMYWSGSLLGNTENCDPVLAAKVINYLISDEGYELTAIGIEGRDFERDANGEIVLLEKRMEDGFPTEAGDSGAHVLATPIVSWVPQEWQDFQLLYGKDEAYRTWYEAQFANQKMYQIENFGRNSTSPLWTEFQSTQAELYNRYLIEAVNAGSLEEVQEIWKNYVNEFEMNGGLDASNEMSEVLKGIYAE